MKIGFKIGYFVEKFCQTPQKHEKELNNISYLSSLGSAKSASGAGPPMRQPPRDGHRKSYHELVPNLWKTYSHHGSSRLDKKHGSQILREFKT